MLEFLSILQVPVTTAILYAVPFIVALMVIVFIHELGHFLVARWCGVAVEAFSIGFGKEITGWHDRHGTRWKLSWIPLGGYVKFAGDANAASFPDAETMKEQARNPDNFHGKPVWQRALIVVAGPMANFILAIFIFAAAFVTVGVPISEPRVDNVMPGSAAERVGLKPGDIIVSIEGKEMKSFDDVVMAVIMRGGDELKMVVDRQGQLIDMVVVPDIVEDKDAAGNVQRIGRLGIQYNAGQTARYERLGPVEAVAKGWDRTYFIVDVTLRYIGKLFTGRESASQIGGVISIADTASTAASMGFFQFVSAIAFLSVSIGLINLFPIPMLDGGHLVYYGIEAVRGKPLGPNAQEWGFRIGFSVVVMLMVVGTWNDLVRKFASVFGS
jgi:regulator of sigma E protease